MKYLLPFAVLAVALVAADDKPADKPADKPGEKKSDNELIQGTWELTGLEADGADLKDGPLFENLKGTKLTFKDATVSNSKRPEEKGTYKLAADKKPAELDLVVMDAAGAVKESVPLVYELKSDPKGDVLKLCAVPSKDAARPKDFSSKNGQVLMTFKREEKKDK